MSDLAEFVLARVAEDEAVAREEDEAFANTTLLPSYDSDHQSRWDTDRVLDECAAKRRIVEWASRPTVRVTADNPAPFEELTMGSDGRLYAGPHGDIDVTERWRAWAREHAEPTHPEALQFLALPYAGHPDYREEWRP